MPTIAQTLAICLAALTSLPADIHNEQIDNAIVACRNWLPKPTLTTKTISNNRTWADAPPELLDKIFSHLPQQDLLEASQASSKWYAPAQTRLIQKPTIQTQTALASFCALFEAQASPAKRTLPKVLDQYLNLRILDLSAFQFIKPHTRTFDDASEKLLARILLPQCQQLVTLKLRSARLSTAAAFLTSASKILTLELLELHLWDGVQGLESIGLRQRRKVPAEAPSVSGSFLSALSRVKTLGIGSCDHFPCRSYWGDFLEQIVETINPKLLSLKFVDMPTMTTAAATTLTQRCGPYLESLELQGEIGQGSSHDLGILLGGFPSLKTLNAACTNAEYLVEPFLSVAADAGLRQIERFSTYGGSLMITDDMLEMLTSPTSPSPSTAPFRHTPRVLRSLILARPLESYYFLHSINKTHALIPAYQPPCPPC